jgi:hypothetical protein
VLVSGNAHSVAATYYIQCNTFAEFEQEAGPKLFGFGLISLSVTVGALAQVPNLAGSGSGGLRSIFMAFGSGTSAWLATFCARHLNYSEVATTLTMLVEVAAAWSLYALLLRDTEVNTILESPRV